MKQILKRVVPASVQIRRVRMLRLRQALAELVPAFADDLRRYLRHSSSTGPYRSLDNLRAKITATYHNIEKGLALPEPRPGFGERPVGDLLLFVSAYVEAYGFDEWLGTPIAVLRSYRDFNRARQVPVPHGSAIEALLTEATAQLPGPERIAGTRTVDREDLYRAVQPVGLEFFTSRSSVRQFSGEPVPMAAIEFAAAAAQRAPAVCNRQFSRIYVYRDKMKMAEILLLQGGARGFGHQLGGLAIITTDLRNFWAAGERHQAWTDGGLFAMNFVLGLHARGLGTVCLNWSKTPAADRELHRLAALPPEAVVIMLVGFGMLLPKFEVAHSQRIPLAETLQLR